ncbi:hypothetical protein DENIS_0823 [Desulfonema ishimotonii]|uniref:Uncharacterized protein n=1 Tax=Desulfonema ishimotonii TaxID=45657 RepID=A0A401FSC8_9BACT|nr:hypothetical protein [Desulfonema ishimotonii]GBC59882.1 hypothetical protein DENIS_0823 [Desulfonema ishimotonii]
MSDKNKVHEIFEQGVHAFVRNHTDESPERFSEGIALNPEFAVAYVSRGADCVKQERVRETIADFSRAIESRPGHGPGVSSAGACP